MDCIKRTINGFEVAAATKRGVGTANEDRFRLCENGLVVADGLGGLEDGEVYAEVAAGLIGKELDRDGEANLVGALHDANRKLFVLKNDVMASDGGASVCACLLMKDGSCEIASAGDVKSFLVNEGGITRVNDVDAALDGSLTNYLGSKLYCSKLTRSISRKSLQAGILMFVTDGVWRYTSRKEVLELMSESEGDLAHAAVAMVDRARSNMSRDDLTVVLCRSAGSSSTILRGK